MKITTKRRPDGEDVDGAAVGLGEEVLGVALEEGPGTGVLAHAHDVATRSAVHSAATRGLADPR